MGDAGLCSCASEEPPHTTVVPKGVLSSTHIDHINLTKSSPRLLGRWRTLVFLGFGELKSSVRVLEHLQRPTGAVRVCHPGALAPRLRLGFVVLVRWYEGCSWDLPSWCSGTTVCGRDVSSWCSGTTGAVGICHPGTRAPRVRSGFVILVLRHHGCGRDLSSWCSGTTGAFGICHPGALVRWGFFILVRWHHGCGRDLSSWCSGTTGAFGICHPGALAPRWSACWSACLLACFSFIFALFYVWPTTEQ